MACLEFGMRVTEVLYHFDSSCSIKTLHAEAAVERFRGSVSKIRSQGTAAAATSGWTDRSGVVCVPCRGGALVSTC